MTATLVVVIPARNEADRIADCLAALAVQDVPGLAVVVVANGCTDRTADVAWATADAAGLHLELLTVTLGTGQGVGTARRLGCARALDLYPEAAALLSTDADCVVAPDWAARNLHHLRSAAMVCGRVDPMPHELHVLDDMDHGPARMEGRYEALVMAFYRMHRPGPCGLAGDHGHAAGASLAMQAAAYRTAGEFGDLATGEDRDLVRRFKAAGLPVWHADDVRVAASCRLDGRAQDGMAAALRARALRTDYLIDDALPPSQALIAAAAQGTLGPWPLHVAPQDRLRATDLTPHIAALEAAMQHP
ncbi:Glycosyltransferase like family 2 [Loktanella fryxellensis]|uniref:Glycosyltransferase like family 2 n=1 Tax=Loktanella fryxellensis TaxID=245187 RepID=A0A1H8H998_9RHOB|nr:glycosyltransferase family A protein [Loktanella fryxellensis]SEN52756.1 Glycosyltransferase like family 2 [Loktanella fryxellensis]